MAKRHVEEYYNKIADQYREMTKDIKDLEERLSENMSSFDALENMKKLVEPIKNNYMVLSWVMFLLNKPNNEKKSSRYEKQGKAVLMKVNPNMSHSPEDIIKENEECRVNLQKLI